MTLDQCHMTGSESHECHMTSDTHLDWIKLPTTQLLFPQSRSRPPLKKKALALYRHLVNHVDSQGRLTAELFMKKPSAKAYPEYYVVIKNPIDFREIAQKIKQDQVRLC